MGCGCGGGNNAKKLKSTKDINNWNKQVARRTNLRAVNRKLAEEKAVKKAEKRARKLAVQKSLPAPVPKKK